MTASMSCIERPCSRQEEPPYSDFPTKKERSVLERNAPSMQSVLFGKKHPPVVAQCIWIVERNGGNSSKFSMMISFIQSTPVQIVY